MLIQGDDVRGMDLTLERVESNDWRGKIVCGFRRIQSNYGQTEDGKNDRVVGDGDDGENSPAMLIQERSNDCRRQRRGKIV
jgi:hypothetical protein